MNVAMIVFACWWLKNKSNWAELLSCFHMISPFASLLTVSLSTLLLLIYAYRLKIILSVGLSESFIVTCLGHGANSLFPLRLGEIFKIFMAKKHLKIPVSSLVVATVMEKLLDVFVILFIGLILASKFNFVKYSLIHICLYSGVTLLGFFLVKNILNSKALHSLIGDTITIMINLITTKKFIYILIASALLWSMTILAIYVFLKINLLDSSFGCIDAMAIALLTALSIALPSVAANIGFYESAVVYYLTNNMAVDTNLALVLALFLHFSVMISQVFFMIIFSLYFYMRNKAK